MSEWRSIETAPKDGTRILLAMKHVNPEPDDVNVDIGAWGKRDWNKEEMWCMAGGDGWRHATHWMPIPSEPEPPS